MSGGIFPDDVVRMPMYAWSSPFDTFVEIGWVAMPAGVLGLMEVDDELVIVRMESRFEAVRRVRSADRDDTAFVERLTEVRDRELAEGSRLSEERKLYAAGVLTELLQQVQ